MLLVKSMISALIPGRGVAVRTRSQGLATTIVKILTLLYHSFMYSPVSLLSGIYPLPAMHSLLVTSDVRSI